MLAARHHPAPGPETVGDRNRGLTIEGLSSGGALVVVVVTGNAAPASRAARLARCSLIRSSSLFTRRGRRGNPRPMLCVWRPSLRSSVSTRWQAVPAGVVTGVEVAGVLVADGDQPALTVLKISR
jgi:hypothetical protein